MMHALNLMEKSILSNSWSKKIHCQSQEVSVHFHKSVRPKDALRRAAVLCNAPPRMPQPACQTRFSSLGTTISILLDLEEPISFVCARAKELNIPAKIVSIVQDPEFWIGMKAIHPVLQGFTKVTKAIQRKNATTADVVRYFIFLTHILEEAKSAIPQGKRSQQSSIFFMSKYEVQPNH
jgi:hypothetical protein